MKRRAIRGLAAGRALVELALLVALGLGVVLATRTEPFVAVSSDTSRSAGVSR